MFLGLRNSFKGLIRLYRDELIIKSKTAAVSKEKQHNSHYSHYSDYYGVKCYVFGVKELIKIINQVAEVLND
jgi:hypothetical protein